MSQSITISSDRLTANLLNIFLFHGRFMMYDAEQVAGRTLQALLFFARNDGSSTLRRVVEDTSSVRVCASGEDNSGLLAESLHAAVVDCTRTGSPLQGALEIGLRIATISSVRVIYLICRRPMRILLVLPSASSAIWRHLTPHWLPRLCGGSFWFMA